MIGHFRSQYETIAACGRRPRPQAEGGAADMTVVFDAGQNSEANFAYLAGTGLHYVGSAPASDCPDLTGLPPTVRSIADKDRSGGLTAYDTRRVVYGTERRAILTHSPELHHRAAIRRPAQGPAPYLGTDATARAALKEELFGKHVLITDHDGWPAARSSSATGPSPRPVLLPPDERPARPVVLPDAPLDRHNIRVHTFTCVLALQTAYLMRLKGRRPGLDLSVRELLGELAGISETVLLYQSERGRPRAHRMLIETTPVQDKLTSVFGLARCAPRQ